MTPLDSMLSDIKDRINKKTIHELRQVARALGVPQPTDGKKDKVMEGIIKLANGTAAPVPRSKKGAPPKSDVYDKQLVADIERCRVYHLAAMDGNDGADDISELSLSDGTVMEQSVTGILDRGEKYFYLRVNGCKVDRFADVFVHDTLVSRYALRVGDYIEGLGRRRTVEQEAGLTKVLKVNGINVDELSPRRVFESLTPVYPDKRLKTAIGQNDIAGRIIDLFAPVGAGQRAFVAAPSASGKTTVLKNIAAGIVANNPDICVTVLLIDERPEEVTDFQRSATGCKLFYTTFDEGADSHIHAVNLVIEYVKRQTESGKDAVLIIDGITRLVRAYNAFETLATSVSAPKKLLSCARNAEEGGSLTIIATLSNEVNLVDGAAYNEFISTANMRLTLSPELVKSRVFPAIDVRASGTGREDLLLTPEEMSAAANIRRRMSTDLTAEGVIELFRQTESNQTLVEKFK